ncbi:dynamin family protein [Rhodococcus aerolatus]
MPLPEQVRRCLDEVTETLAAADPDAAARVRRARAAAQGVPTLVVVGETLRGKSSLVNALLDTEGLSPVSAGAATAVPVVLRHGDVLAARAWFADGRAPVEVAPDRLADWALGDSGDGVGGGLPEGLPPPRHLEVDVPADLLRGLTLVDTPGIGGLDGRHAELAARAAENATALLVVLDAGAPAGRGELEFCTWLAERVETVVVALGRTDAHPDWRAVAAEDAALLARHAPRLAGATLHPVSARLAALAGSAATAELRAALAEQSGVDALRDVLRTRVSERAALLHHANVLRALHTELRQVGAAVAAREAALRTGSAAEDARVAALRTRREELVAARRGSGRGYQLRLRALVARARVESTHEVARECRGLTAWFRARVDAADRAGLARLPAELDPALAVVAARLSAGMAGRVSALVEEVLGELFTPDERAQVADVLGRRAPLVPATRPAGPRASGSDDKLMVVAGASGGVGLGRLVVAPLVLVPGLNVLLVPLTLGLGAGAAWFMARARAHVADKAHVRQWGADAVAEARSALEEVVAAQLIEVEHQLGAALDEAVGRQVDRVDAELRDVDAALRLAAGERAEAARELARLGASLGAGCSRVDDLLAALRTARVRVVTG